MIELYQQTLTQHSNHPIGLMRPIAATHRAEGYNASCGDELTFSLQIEKSTQRILDISFNCDCCAICKASASALCELVIDQDIQYIQQQASELDRQLNGMSSLADQDTLALSSKLTFLVPVKNHLSRINCALLPWQTVIKACGTPVAEQSQQSQTIQEAG